MIEKRKQEFLPKINKQPLISECISEKDFRKRKKMKIKKAMMAYFITTLVMVAVVLALILSCVSEYRPQIFTGELFSVAKIIIGGSFMDMSLNGSGDSSLVGSIIDVIDGVLYPVEKPLDKVVETDDETTHENTVSKDTMYDFDYSKVPQGETPIIPMDLSLQSYGRSYIHNSTGLVPDVQQLLDGELKGATSFEYLSSSSPTVLIIHTHGTEAYCKDGAVSIKETGELARSENTEENVVSVGRVFKEALKRQGINSIHCEILHDADGYKEAYSRAEETIKQYLNRYPTIQLVIDIHRDAIVKSDGDIVRPVTEVDGNAVAQVMCVVGSDWGGEANDKWEGNLSLALKLREELNSNGNGVCRPVYLKGSTYNQEIAPYSLLLEIGACGNSVEEAKAAAELTAIALSEIILKK